MQNAPSPPCPSGGATHVVRNGSNQSGTPTFLCRGCGRRFVARPKAGPVPDATRQLVRRLPGERVGVRAIARATGVSRSWVQGFVNGILRDDARWAVDPPPAAEKKSAS